MEEQEDKKPIVEVLEDDQVQTFSNPLDENPNNVFVGGKYINGRNIVDANGNVIGTVKTASEAAAEEAAAKKAAPIKEPVKVPTP